MDLIRNYFPDLSPQQLEQFTRLEELYRFWNDQINVISRKDMANFYEHHVLHSLGIAKVMEFLPGTRVMDIGTGGGFPGIPLAILFPETDFLLTDSIGKKIKVVTEVSSAIGLTNVEARHTRSEEVKEKFQFIISRAVTTLPDFMKWVSGKITPGFAHSLPNGVLYLKGGDLEAELAAVRNHKRVFNLSDYFSEAFFETKKVVHVRC
jgi:16S rRNA (guanine527-N7)-methyltransferase